MKEPINAHIHNYVGLFPVSGISKSTVENAIKANIKANAIGVKTPTKSMSIEDGLNNIRQCLTGFAQQVDPSTANELTASIQLQLQKRHRSFSSRDNTQLEQAVKVTLYAMQSKANYMKENIDALTSDHLTGYNFGKNLTDATTDVGKMRGLVNIGHGSGSHAKKIDEALKALTGSIKSLTGLLMVESDGQQGAIFRRLDEVETKVIGELHDVKKGNDENGIIELHSEEAAKLFDTLRTELCTIIEYIQDAANNANTQLQNDIKTIRNALSKANATITNGISHVQNILIKKTEDAFMQLTNHVQKVFTDQNLSDLKAFHKLAETQLKAIEEIIRIDKLVGIKGLLHTMNSNEDLLNNIVRMFKSPLERLSAEMYCEKFSDISDELKSYVDNVLVNVQYQLVSHGKPVDQAFTLSEIEKRFDDFVNYLVEIKDANKSRIYIFDHTYTQKHDLLSTSLSALHPSAFANPRHPELLDAVRAGLQGFVKEMERVYVNKYEGSDNVIFFGLNTKQMTEDGKNCAKIFLTILKTLYNRLHDLYMKCSPFFKGQWQNMNICLYNVDKHLKRDENFLGHWIQRRGFVVPTDKDTQNGELRYSASLKGDEIIKLCNNEITTATKETKELLKATKLLSGDTVKLINLLSFLYRIKLPELYKVCHLNMRRNPKPPTTIYQMMQWLPGLVYSPMFVKVCDYAKESFSKPEGHKNESYDKIPVDKLQLSATTNFKWQDIRDKITNACLYSHDTLIAIVGHGHAGGRYATDFFTNEDNFIYPSSPSACFDMLVDILNRVYFQLYFLYKQCHNGRTRGGWQDCYYGRHVGGSAWTCNEEQCGNQSCPQKAEQTADQNDGQTGIQNADQTCNQHPTCGVKSPLQSYLEDGLQGFLPHYLTKVGCGVKCLVTNHFGKPCLTPMGFSDIGITASHTKDGKYLKEALHNYCSSQTHLSELCGMLSCLLRQAPQTLGDMFAFYYRFLHHWSKPNEHKKEAFDSAVQKANFGDSTTQLDVASIQNSSGHSNHVTDDGKKYTGDLFTLSSCNPSTRATIPCGPYLQSLSNDMRVYFSKHNGGAYLSWVVYMTETFYDLLKKLYDECCKNCNKPGSRCHDRSCVRDCQVNYCYEHNKPTPEEGKGELIKKIRHSASCNSIVQCRNTHATIYAAGFTFGSPSALTDHADKTKRTCQDFCKALEKVCSDSSVLARLVHDYIPKFLWQIREKFFWTTVALWSLSLLYLICVMVGRLDVLHIKSHLRTPSSHKIAAQSLLAAAQVGRLAKISYLQP